MNMGQGGAEIRAPVQCCTECNNSMENGISNGTDLRASGPRVGLEVWS